MNFAGLISVRGGCTLNYFSLVPLQCQRSRQGQNGWPAEVKSPRQTLVRQNWTAQPDLRASSPFAGLQVNHHNIKAINVTSLTPAAFASMSHIYKSITNMKLIKTHLCVISLIQVYTGVMLQQGSTQ